MDDVKRDNKVKRSKSDVKNVISTYLEKRNYPSVSPIDISKKELVKQQLVDSEISRPNSILYSCCNSDPVVIDQNFAKFISWLKDLTKHKNKHHDIEYIVGPLFCHLYLDILKGGNSERAAAFFKCHLPSIDKLKCDNMVLELINSLHSNDIEKSSLKNNYSNDSEKTMLKNDFRSNKYLVDLYPESLAVLQKFILENCHVVFLQVLQTWFEIEEIAESDCDEESVNESVLQSQMSVNGDPNDPNYSKLANIISELENEAKPLLNIKIHNTKDDIGSGLLRRQCGLIAFSENSHVRLKPIHNYDSILNNKDYGDIKLTGHSGQVYSIDLAANNHFLSTGSSDATICIYNLRDFNISHICKGHLGPVYCTKISTNGEYVASGSQDTTARLWSLHTGQTLRVFVGHTQSITSIDIHPNSLYLATGSADFNIRLWNLHDGNLMRLLHGAKGTIYSLVFHPNGTCLASASDDKTIRIWDLTNSKILVELQCTQVHEPIFKLTWSTDGKLLCGGTCDGVISVWDFNKIQQNLNDTSYCEPIQTHCVNNKLLSLEYAFGSFATLTT